MAAYFAAATRAALVLAALRAPFRGRSTPVNAWWGSFDLAVSLFSGQPAEPPAADFITRNAGNAEQIEVGWWPGDARYPKRPSSPMRFRRRTGLQPPRLRRRLQGGTPPSANTSSTGTTSSPAHTPTRMRSSSPAPRSGTVATSAAGTPTCLPAPGGFPAGRLGSPTMTNRRFAALCLALSLALCVVLPAGGGSAGAAATVKVAFLKGEQMTTVDRPGSSVARSVRALLSGPTPRESRRASRPRSLPGPGSSASSSPAASRPWIWIAPSSQARIAAAPPRSWRSWSSPSLPCPG